MRLIIIDYKNLFIFIKKLLYMINNEYLLSF